MSFTALGIAAFAVIVLVLYVNSGINAEEREKLREDAAEVTGAPMVDTATYWTPEKFVKEIIEANKVTVVHWRIEGTGNNKLGDRFMSDLLGLYGNKIDRAIMINLGAYHKKDPVNEKNLRELLGTINPEEGRIRRAPSWSLILKDGKEIRMRGPPIEGGYEKDLKENYLPILDKYLK